MANFQHNRNKRNFLHSKPALIVLTIIVIAFAWNVFGFWNKMEETSKNKQIAEEKIVQLQDQKTKLSANIDTLNTNEGVEAEIRDKFGMVKPGEGLIVVVDDKTPPPTPPQSASSKFFSFFKNLFK